MLKVRNLVEITPNLPFSEFNFYELYRETFEKSELGRMKKILPLREMAGSLKIQELQNLLAEAWKPYMKNLDTMFTDATCYESEMRYPTDQKLLWECVEKGYELMCEASLTYRKQRKHTKGQAPEVGASGVKSGRGCRDVWLLFPECFHQRIHPRGGHFAPRMVQKTESRMNMKESD